MHGLHHNVMTNMCFRPQIFFWGDGAPFRAPLPTSYPPPPGGGLQGPTLFYSMFFMHILRQNRWHGHNLSLSLSLSLCCSKGTWRGGGGGAMVVSPPPPDPISKLKPKLFRYLH